MTNDRPDSAIQVSTVLFAPGQRPDRAALAALGERTGAFAVAETADATDTAAEPSPWVELVAGGLTFDLTGLAPSAPIPGASAPYRIGLGPDFAAERLESLTLAPGPHLAGAEHLLPVVRVAAAVLASLTELPGIMAIGWSPARNLTAPAWFAGAVRSWVEGGPFPALALAALARGDRVVTTCGMAFFIGQEVRLETGSNPPSERHARAVVRLIDWLIAHGKLERAREIILPGIGSVSLDPDHRGTIVAKLP